MNSAASSCNAFSRQTVMNMVRPTPLSESASPRLAKARSAGSRALCRRGNARPHDRDDGGGLETARDEVNLVLAHVLERELVWRGAVVESELRDGTEIRRFGEQGHVAYRHVVDHELAQWRRGLRWQAPIVDGTNGAILTERDLRPVTTSLFRLSRIRRETDVVRSIRMAQQGHSLAKLSLTVLNRRDRL